MKVKATTDAVNCPSYQAFGSLLAIILTRWISNRIPFQIPWYAGEKKTSKFAGGRFNGVVSATARHDAYLRPWVKRESGQVTLLYLIL